MRLNGHRIQMVSRTYVRRGRATTQWTVRSIGSDKVRLTLSITLPWKSRTSDCVVVLYFLGTRLPRALFPAYLQCCDWRLHRLLVMQLVCLLWGHDTELGSRFWVASRLAGIWSCETKNQTQQLWDDQSRWAATIKQLFSRIVMPPQDTRKME